MKRLLITLLIFFSVLHAQAQIKNINPENFPWYDGQIIFHSGDTINCRLRFGQVATERFLQVRDGENILTLSVTDVSAFSFFDEKKNRIRNFYTLSVMENEATRNREFFMEYVYGDANFSILNHRTMGLAYDYMEYSPIKRKAAVNKRYLLDIQSGKLVPMSKDTMIELLQQKKPEILSYIENNSLKFKSVSDFIHVLEYYASL